jgi:dienelactone hydrolase
VRGDLGATRVGAVGYCFGGKYVSRWLAAGRGIDVGFVAHPSNLLEAEIRAVTGPLSIAAGSKSFPYPLWRRSGGKRLTEVALDASFNATAKGKAEGILAANNVTFQSSVYSQAPHGFAVRPNATIPQQVFAKQGAFVQAVTWLDAWL